MTKGQSVLIDPSTNQAVNVTRNLPELSLYSTGAIPFAGIKFFDDATFKGGIYYNGFYDGIGITNNSSKPGLYWRSTTERVGIDTFEPRGKLHIKANSLPEEAHLLIQQANNDYGRINFESNVPANGRWTLAGSINATSSLSRLHVFSSQEGENLMSFTGDGKVGIGVDDPQYVLHIKTGTEASNNTTGTVSIGANNATHMNIDPNEINVFYDGSPSPFIQGTLFLNNLSDGDVVVGNNTGSDMVVKGSTQLGESAPAIKMKRLWGQLLNASGTEGSVAHGVDADEILSIQAVVKDGTDIYPASGNGIASSNYQFRTYCDATYCYIKGAGSALMNDYFTILIIYRD